MSHVFEELNDLPEVAWDLLNRFNDAGFEQPLFRQVMNFAEESGEFVGAIRRSLGLARRKGSQEEVASELADVLITTFVLAELLNINPAKALKKKLDIIYSRGWKEES